MENEQPNAKKYSAIKNRVFFLELLESIILLVFLQFSGISIWLKSGALRFSNNFFLVTATYSTFLGGILYLTSAPLGFYKSYVLEHRFGLSNQSLISWLKDEFKKVIISYIIFLLFAEFLYLFLRHFPHTWWMWMAVAWILFGIVSAKLAPVLIIPLFFKYTRLGDKELKNRLIRLAQRCGVKILDVFKLDLSAKTRKANAALAGIGNTRRILLADTLLDAYTKEEIEVILAHELAHYKFKHIWRTLISGGACAVIGFYLINISLMSLMRFLNLTAIYDIVLFPSIMLLLTIFGIIILPIQNWHSRALERKADLFAVKLTKLPNAFISCMNKLARQNLANVSPSRFIEIMLYDHPPISRRIEAAHKLMKGGLTR